MIAMMGCEFQISEQGWLEVEHLLAMPNGDGDFEFERMPLAPRSQEF